MEKVSREGIVLRIWYMLLHGNTDPTICPQIRTYINSYKCACARLLNCLSTLQAYV